MEERESSDPDSVVTHDRHSTLDQVRSQVVQMAQNQLSMLIGGQCVSRTKQNHRWTPAPGQRAEGSEVGVGRHDDPVLTLGEQQEIVVFGSLEAQFEGVNGIVSALTK